MGQDGRVLSARGTDGHGFSVVKESGGHNGLMDLLLERTEEAVLTERVSGLGPFEHGTSLDTVTALDRHDDTHRALRSSSEKYQIKTSLTGSQINDFLFTQSLHLSIYYLFNISIN